MPFSSMYPDIEIPDIDLWGLMFEKEREEKFPYDQSKSPGTVIQILWKLALISIFFSYLP